MKKIRINLQYHLDRKGISRRELSRRVNVRFPTINDMCNNEIKRPPLDVLAKILDELDIGIEELLIVEEEDET